MFRYLVLDIRLGVGADQTRIRGDNGSYQVVENH